MAQTRRRFLGVVSGSLVLAGCVGDDGGNGDDTDGADDNGSTGSDNNGSGDDGGTDGTSDGDESDAETVQVANTSEHGDILTGPDGRSLYMFDSDEQDAGASTCSGGCADNWPPLTAEEPVAADAVDAELTTFEREDGSMQVAANGWPLYYFANDEAEGDTNGQGLNDVWWVLDPSGEPIRGTGSEDDGDDGGGTGYGDSGY